MTLSKLKQEVREACKNPNWHDGECKVALTGSGNCYCQIVEIESFITAQIEKAYLSALSDVEKGLPKDIFITGVKELITKLKKTK